MAGDPRVCVTVEEFPTYDTIRGVMIHGQADPVGSGPAAEAIPEGFVPVRVVSSHVVSFDFRKIAPQPAPAPAP